MTRDERVAAEWEARHDVAARGAQASSAGVQDYLRHRHAEELLGHPSEHRHPSAPVPEPAVTEETAASRRPGGGSDCWAAAQR
jgi:hypothetical protein